MQLRSATQAAIFPVFYFKKCVVVCVLHTSSECGILSFHHVVLTEETWVSGLVAGVVTHSQLDAPFLSFSFLFPGEAFSPG